MEGLCWEGRGNEAFKLLDELRKRDCLMSEKTYNTLLNRPHITSGGRMGGYSFSSKMESSLHSSSYDIYISLSLWQPKISSWF